MRRRFGRPSLLGTAVRTAVIAGTATATINAVGGGRRDPAAPQDAPQAAPAAPEPTASGLTDDTLTKLKQLGELHAAGVLNDQEFSQAKAKLLS
jgi:hypothetical protein